MSFEKTSFPASISALALSNEPYGVAVTSSGKVVVGGWQEAFILDLQNGQIVTTLLVPEKVRVWRPAYVTATTSTIVVSNWASVEDGGGLFTYSLSGEFKDQILACNYPRGVAATRDGIALLFASRECGSVELYKLSSSKLHLVRKREQDVSLADPHFVTVDTETDDVIVTHRDGVTALTAELSPRWSYRCSEQQNSLYLSDPRGVCMDVLGRICVADCRCGRAVVLSRDGQLLRTLPLPGASGELIGLTIDNQQRLCLANYSSKQLNLIHSWQSPRDLLDELGRLRRQLKKKSEDVVELSRELSCARQEVIDQTLQYNNLQNEFEKSQRLMWKKSDDVEELEKQLSQSQDLVTQQARRIQSFQSDLEKAQEKNAQAEDLKAELAQVKQEIVFFEEMIAESKETERTNMDVIKKLKGELEEYRSQRISQSKEIEILKSKLTESALHNMQTEEKLEKATYRINELLEDKRNLNELLTEARESKFQIAELEKRGDAAFMSKEIDVLTKNRTFLINELIPNELIDYLLQYGVLTAEDSERIRSRATTQDQVRTLLDVLPRRGPAAYSVFRTVLQHTCPHVLEHLDQSRDH